MSTRTLIAAAAAFTVFASGAAFAEGESHIDYTNQPTAATRAEVMAETMAFKQMNDDRAFTASELYGSVDPQAISSDTTREAVMAEAVDFRVDTMSYQYFEVNEAYNGVPSLDNYSGSSTIGEGE